MDPYSAPSAPMLRSEPPRDALPTGLSAVGIVSIVAGSLGLFGGLASIGGLLFGSAINNAFVQPGPLEAAQREMMDGLHAVTAQFMIPSLIVGMLVILISIALLVGGIGVLRRKASSKGLLRKALFATAGLELIGLVLYGLTQSQTMPITEVYMIKVMEQSNPNGAGAMLGPMKIVALIGVVMWAGWSLTKAVLCIIGARYLGKQIKRDQDSSLTTNVGTS